jgi:hypothetical protein
MEISNFSYKFKICVTIEEYVRAINYLESISTYIEELSYEDVELFKRLKKGLLKNYSKQLLSLRKIKQEEGYKSNRTLYRQVMEGFSSNLYADGITQVERFLSCLDNLFSKIKDEKLFALMYKIKASLFAFLYEFSNVDKNKHLEHAYLNYKAAIDICMKRLLKLDIIRIKIFYSYCKFSFKYLNDKYRSILFSINVINEIHQSKLEEEAQMKENGGDDNDIITLSPDFVKIEKKFKLFYESNLEEYNKVIRVYHPEYKV